MLRKNLVCVTGVTNGVACMRKAVRGRTWKSRIFCAGVPGRKPCSSLWSPSSCSAHKSNIQAMVVLHGRVAWCWWAGWWKDPGVYRPAGQRHATLPVTVPHLQQLVQLLPQHRLVGGCRAGLEARPQRTLGITGLVHQLGSGRLTQVALWPVWLQFHTGVGVLFGLPGFARQPRRSSRRIGVQNGQQGRRLGILVRSRLYGAHVAPQSRVIVACRICSIALGFQRFS